MLTEALQFLIRTLLGLMATSFWLRFYLQLARVPFHHPFAQFILRITDFAVRPLRRVLPGLLGLDLSSLLLTYVAELLIVLLVALVSGYPFYLAGPGVLPGFLLLGVAETLHLALQILVVAIIAQAVLSWVSPLSQASAVFHALTAPVLNPIRRVIPLVANIDLSPLVAIILLQLVMMLPVAALEHSAQLLIR